jgi:hypothetical protein
MATTEPSSAQNGDAQSLRRWSSTLACEQGHLNHQARQRWFFRRVSWDITADGLQRHFASAAGAAKEARWWENIYVERDDSHRSIRLFFGTHPMPGIHPNDVETGASLTVSQASTANVVVFFFPFESENVRRSKPRLIWGQFDGPQDIHAAATRKMVRDFLVYARVSSGLMAPSWLDRQRIALLEHRSRSLEGGTFALGLQYAAVVSLLIGSALSATLLALWWIHPDDGKWLEPAVGLVTLMTGWTVLLVQRTRHAVEKALTREQMDRQEADRRRQLRREKRRKRSTE